MKTIFIKDLEKGLIIANETFLIVASEECKDKNNRTYCKLTIGDKTGRVEAKIWSDALVGVDMKMLKSGNLINVSAKVEEYKGQFQINILKAMPVDETQLDDYLETSMYPTDEMLAELQSEIEQMKDASLKAIIREILEDSEVKKKFSFYPAGSSVHHDFRSGLLQHVLEMISISKGILRFYPMVDYDIILSGIILHDIGKIYEFETTGVGATYTVQGSLIGHIVLGALLFNKHAEGKIDEAKRIHITHLILSHHGQKDMGSPVTPATIEAFILTYLDNMSSKARAAEKSVKSIGEGQNLSNFNPWIGNVKVWNGKLLPTETQKIEEASSKEEWPSEVKDMDGSSPAKQEPDDWQQTLID